MFPFERLLPYHNILLPLDACVVLWNWISPSLWNNFSQDVESLPDISQPQPQQNSRSLYSQLPMEVIEVLRTGMI